MCAKLYSGAWQRALLQEQIPHTSRVKFCPKADYDMTGQIPSESEGTQGWRSSPAVKPQESIFKLKDRKKNSLKRCDEGKLLLLIHRKYTALVSLDQRQSYKDDFNAEYDEYRQLHARVEGITRRFTQLDAQCRKLVPGTKEHQVIQTHCFMLFTNNKTYFPMSLKFII